MFDLKPYERKNAVSSYNPFREMEEMERNFFGTPFSFFGSKALDEFKTDISDEGDAFVLEADLPGFKKENISLDIDGETMTIRAERKSEHDDKDKKGNFVRRERSYGMYTRSFDISGVEAEKISAKYDNGVLSVSMPKRKELPAGAKKIEIQ